MDVVVDSQRGWGRVVEQSPDDITTVWMLVDRSALVVEFGPDTARMMAKVKAVPSQWTDAEALSDFVGGYLAGRREAYPDMVRMVVPTASALTVLTDRPSIFHEQSFKACGYESVTIKDTRNQNRIRETVQPDEGYDSDGHEEI